MIQSHVSYQIKFSFHISEKILKSAFFDDKAWKKPVFRQTFFETGPKWPEVNFGQGMPF